MGLLRSNSAAKEWCASTGTAAAATPSAAARTNQNRTFITLSSLLVLVIERRRLLVLVTDEFDQIGVEHDAMVHSDRERLRVRFRIFDGNRDLEIAVVQSAEPF